MIHNIKSLFTSEELSLNNINDDTFTKTFHERYNNEFNKKPHKKIIGFKKFFLLMF